MRHPEPFTAKAVVLVTIMFVGASVTQATAVAADTGLVAKADYQDGMAVLVETETGLMVDASVGGQEFKYEPKIRNY